MPAPWTLGLLQTATYVPPGTLNAYGRRGAGVAVLVSCRWQDEVNTVRDAQGNEHATVAVVYVGQEVANGGFLALGDYTDQADSDGQLDTSDVEGRPFREIRQVSVSRGLDGAYQLVRARVG